ncbi:MAG: porphobilinogen synthase [Rhodobacteraceae bacterium]|nr:porphobilinogen synthase [Paracoccaceae bacterium]
MTYRHPRFPVYRPRRLRRNGNIRRLVSESSLDCSDLIWPIFVCEHSDRATEVSSMPGVRRLTIDHAEGAAAEAAQLGIPCIALFPEVSAVDKSDDCREAWNPDSLANRATRQIKARVPEVLVMLDVALDPYNAAGHDGLVEDGEIVNDPTLRCLQKQALSHADAGADILGPSDMMDGRIGAIRHALDKGGHASVLILSYAAKFASAFYGPFRDAIGSGSVLVGDKKTYQMDPANSDEACRMVARDLSEGADMVMVKPGMPYLDVCQRVKSEFRVPTFAYQVSGEYAMLRAAADQGHIDLDSAVMESLLAFKRAGCDGILTYFAQFAARKLADRNSR